MIYYKSYNLTEYQTHSAWVKGVLIHERVPVTQGGQDCGPSHYQGLGGSPPSLWDTQPTKSIFSSHISFHTIFHTCRHHPTDVLTGLLLGFFIAFILYRQLYPCWVHWQAERPLFEQQLHRMNRAMSTGHMTQIPSSTMQPYQASGNAWAALMFSMHSAPT